MSTTITVAPSHPAQPVYGQPAYAQPRVAQIQALPPAVASSYTTGATLPQYGSLPAVVPAVVSDRAVFTTSAFLMRYY